MRSKALATSSELLPWRTRWTILLLAIVVVGSAYRLAEIAVGIDTTLVRTFSLIAIGLGWVLASGPTRGLAAVVVAVIAGVSVLTIRIGQIGPQLLAIPEEIIQWISASIRLEEIVSADALLSAASDLAIAVGVLYSRVWQWLGTLTTDQWGADPVASAFLWSTLIWFASVWSAWALRRRGQPLAAVLPILTILGISYLLSRGPGTAFAIPLWGTLLLMAFANHDARVRSWEKAGVDSPEGKTVSLAIIVVPVAILLTLAAAWVQGFSIGRFVSIVEGVTGGGARVERDLASSLGLDRGSATDTGLEPLFSPGLPNSHLVGSGPELSEQIVMNIAVTNMPVEGPTPVFRWKSASYDQYLGRGWRTSDLYLRDYQAGELLREPDGGAHQVVRQVVRELDDLGGRIFAAGVPAVFDQTVQVAWRQVGDDLFAITTETQPYQVESILVQASPMNLRAAGTDYPDWVREYYLGLPGEVPERVLALARDLTATSATPYDRAVAIETYLRKIPYNLDVPRPPVDRDVVDYFLFDLEQGYCDYYASSMVVLARAAGIPARLVVGYATGPAERTEGIFRYTISEAEAHSWVEVYFPEIGWVEFEPTGGRAAIERSDTVADLPTPEAPVLELARPSPFRIQFEAPLIGGLAAAVVGWAVWVLLVDPLRLQRQSPRRALRELYRRLRGHASHLGVDLTPGDTPIEFQTAIAKSRLGYLRAQTQKLISAYARAAYAPTAVDDGESSQLIRSWRRLSLRLWLERLKTLLKAP